MFHAVLKMRGGWQSHFLLLLFLLFHLRAQKQDLMCFLRPLVHDAADGDNKADEKHETDNRKNKSEVRKIICDAKVVVRENRRRADPAKIIQVPSTAAAQSDQLEHGVHWKAQVKLINAKPTNEHGQEERSYLRLARRAAFWIGPVTVALAEG